MYDRTIDNKELTFHVSGMLYKRSLIMRDVETGSYWSHLLGRAMQGPMHKKQLEVLPSTITDWKTWNDSHPATQVMMMSKTRMEFSRSTYKDKTRYGAGANNNDKQKIWSFWGLSRTPLLNDEFEKQQIVIWYDKPSSGVWGWERKLNDQLLQFEMKEQSVVDKQTGSTWNLTTGRATGGKLNGAQLKAFVLIPTFQRAWRTFHPQTAIWPKDDPYTLEGDPIPTGGVVAE